MKSDLGIHVVQSPEWGEFKLQMGTHPVKVGDVQFTKHKIPFTPYYVGYAPKVNFQNQRFSWPELRDTAKAEKCVLIRFDAPNVISSKQENPAAKRVVQSLEENCKKSPRNTFTKWNVLLDISATEEELIAAFTSKTRYNSRLASRKGVEVRLENNTKGVKIFNDLMVETGKRQGFFPHSRAYYEKAFETLSKYNMAHLLIAYFGDEPIAAWMLFSYKGVLYYPYGASTSEHRDLMASSLLGWEAIKLGKKLGCTLFDMWGATPDEHHPYWGFTRFKLGYGGELVEYIDSYDFVANPLIYYPFNLGYNLFWKFVKIIKK